MNHQGPSRVCPQGDPRGGMWQSLERPDDGCQSPQGWLLLRDPPRRLHRICKEMRQVLGVRSPTPLEARSATQHDIPMAVHHLTDGHHRPLCPRKGTNKIPPSRSRLFNQMD